MAERMGLEGKLILCILGKLYMIPGREPEEAKCSYVSLDNIFLEVMEKASKLVLLVDGMFE